MDESTNARRTDRTHHSCVKHLYHGRDVVDGGAPLGRLSRGDARLDVRLRVVVSPQFHELVQFPDVAESHPHQFRFFLSIGG